MRKSKDKYIKRCIRLISVLILAVFCIITGGCSKEKDDNQKTTVNGNSNVNNNGNSNVNNNGNSKDGIDLDNYSLEYVIGKDSTPWYFWSNVAESEWGYYMWDEVTVGNISEPRVMFLDKASKQYVPLCSNPNCTHDVEGCNALFSYSEYEGIEGGRIYYYDGNVYVVGIDKEKYMCLYRISEDGSQKEKYMKLYKTNVIETENEMGGISSEFSYPEVCIHRGYVYFIINRESELKIRRIKLGEENTEEIFSMTGERQSLYRMKAYGDYLFFQGGNFVDDNYIGIDGGIMAYNINTGETSMVKKGAINEYHIFNENIYYSTADGISVYSLTDLTDTVLLSGMDSYPAFSVNNSYVFILNGSLKVYDFDGKLIKTNIMNIDNSEMSEFDFLYGNKVLFAKHLLGYLYLDTEDINNAKWIAIK